MQLNVNFIYINSRTYSQMNLNMKGFTVVIHLHFHPVGRVEFVQPESLH